MLAVPRVRVVTFGPHSHVLDRPYLDEKAGRRLKMGKTATAAGQGRSGGCARRCSWATVSGNRTFRPHRRHRLLHQGSRGPLRRGQRNARRSLQFRRQAGADRPQGERGLRASARRAFRGAGSQGHRRGLIDPRPDGASSLSGRQRGLVPDLEGAAGRRRRRHPRPRRHFARRAGFVAAGPGFRRRFPPRSPISTTISTQPLRIPDLAARAGLSPFQFRSENSGPVWPLRWPVSVPAAHRPGVRPAPAYRGALERIGARMRLRRSGGVHPPVP